MKNLMKIALIAALPVIAACASIVKGTTQSVNVITPNVQGAKCVITEGNGFAHNVVTPAVITLEKSKKSITVSCKKEGYHDVHQVIESDFEAMTAGNLIAGGIIGAGIDAATGAMNKYPNSIQIFMNKKQ